MSGINLTVLPMKISILFFALLLALAGSGCAWLPTAPAAAKPSATAPAPIVTPDYSLAAKVVSVNAIGRFVVLSFPASQMPKTDQTLFIYRAGLKVAEGNVAMLIFLMKTRWGFRETLDVGGNNGGPIRYFITSDDERL